MKQLNKHMRPLVFVATFVAGFLFFGVDATHAQINVSNLQTVQETAGLGNQDIRVTIGLIIRTVLGFLGIIALLLVLYGGFLWMTAGGNEDQIGKAKKIFINAGIGLLIILSAFSITQFVLSRLQDATGTDVGFGNSGGSGGTLGGKFKGGSALGTIIESHYPERNQKDAPRNTPIVVTFKIAIDPKSVMQSPSGKSTPLGTPQQGSGSALLYDELKPGALELYPESGPSKDKPTKEKLVTAFHVTMTPDKKTFMFEPVEPLGSATEPTQYAVRLTNAILNANGKTIFSGKEDDYIWSFTVSTVLDTTPPKVISTFPKWDTTKKVPRNVGVLVNFDEPIFPMVAAGTVAKGYSIITVGKQKSGTLEPVLGTFRVANNYRTVEFQADDPSNYCGKNACGKEMYCLPPSASMQVLVKTADVKVPGSSDPSAKIDISGSPATFGINGIVDMAKNALDGGGERAKDADGKASGPPSDHFFFSFETSAHRDLASPSVISVQPTILSQNVNTSAQPTILFNKPMMPSTFSQAQLFAEPASLRVGFTKKFADEPLASDAPEAEYYDTRSAAILSHGTNFSPGGKYTPHLPSSITDIAGNCFYPATDQSTCKGSNAQWCCNGNPSTSACIPAGSTL